MIDNQILLLSQKNEGGTPLSFRSILVACARVITWPSRITFPSSHSVTKRLLSPRQYR